LGYIYFFTLRWENHYLYYFLKGALVAPTLKNEIINGEKKTKNSQVDIIFKEFTLSFFDLKLYGIEVIILFKDEQHL